MQIPVYDLTVPQFMMTLTSLKNILTKAKAWGEPRKIDMSTFFGARLALDMLPLGRQIQIVTDNAKGCVARLTGVTAPVFEDKEVTFDDYINRINKTIAFLETAKPEQFQGYEARKAEFPWMPGKYLEGKDYLVQHALPNFYFHATTAYAILRHNGVDLGKSDFLGAQNYKMK